MRCACSSLPLLFNIVQDSRAQETGHKKTMIGNKDIFQKSQKFVSLSAPIPLSIRNHLPHPEMKFS
jgi:hypothetical protein